MAEPVLQPTENDLLRNHEASARAGGLHYMHDGLPGIRRIRCGRGFRYTGPQGAPVRDPKTLERIRSLVIPPAWTGVWICPSPRGHLQATGRDARGRKQYLYHADWAEVRNQVKFSHILAFAGALPGLRRQVDADLRRRGLCRERVLATVVRLLEASLIRVGNEEYQKENRSYGLTTLRRRHVEIDSVQIRFAFRGKSGRWQEKSVRDRRVARVLRRILDLPGQELFRYLDGERIRIVDSDDVNDYLRQATGSDFTAKDIRTWHATVCAACALKEAGQARTAQEAKKNITGAVREVANLLGNRPAASRKYYIHPAILTAYRDGRLIATLETIAGRLDDTFPAELDTMENAVHLFLLWDRQKEEVRH